MRYKKNDLSLLKATELLKILSHPVRLSILCDLIHEGSMSAGQIAERQAARASQSQVSQYLAELRKRKFIKSKREGQYVYYTFSSPFIKSLINLLYKEYCKKN